MPPFDATFDAPIVTRSEACTARSLWFGNPDAPLFGWFHPAGARARDGVVVLCNPFGYDASAAHYAYQQLADRLSRAGVAALRFDYAGTGDSAGDDEGPDRVVAWLGSIEAAVAEARRQSGASKVILFGARLGALLATVYAQTTPADGLVLLGPPRSGSTFIRELLAFNKMRTASPGEGASPDISFPDDEHLGFALPSELRKAVSDLDPRTIGDPPAPRALVIARDDVPGPEVRLVEHLRDLGVAVQHSHARGYSDVFDFRALPPETVDEVVAWLHELPLRPLAPAECGWTSQRREGPFAATFDGLSEEAVRFEGLFGMVTHPAGGTALRETGILLLGAGANQHVGISRMNVTFARDLAKLGFRVLRFDLSGIGESPARPGQPDRYFYTSQAVPETRIAIDFMVARGCKQVALAGLCSGGYTAFHTAVRDARVAAIVPVNVPGFHFNDADSSALTANRPALPWMRASVLMSQWLGFPRGRSGHRGPPPRTRLLLDDPDDVARGFGAAVARGCQSLMIYGSADPGLQVLEGHLGPGLAKARGERNLRMALVQGCDHIFTPRIAQQRLRSLVSQFFDRGLT